ncbi:putative Amino acid permease/ SLC12A domain-containing protein [Seiridium unicorne]|uniref:Amino acid permease/ SLC12A domain-containing protein n=1 Tax=Seiridium unicorne TaxID=138068 RepID=A0ABR2UTL3_9PEZI
MKPVVSAMQAWSCVVISAFAILILSVIGSLFRTGHHEFTGGKDDPDPKVGGEVAGTIFIAVIVYAGHSSGFAHYLGLGQGFVPRREDSVYKGHGLEDYQTTELTLNRRDGHMNAFVSSTII